MFQGQIHVYRNLHKKGMFSVREKGEKGYRVAGHVPTICLSSVSFVVKEPGRVRTIEKQREVHAWCTGQQIAADTVRNTGRVIRYCPFERNCFFFLDTGEPVSTCAAVILQDNQVFLAEVL